MIFYHVSNNLNLDGKTIKPKLPSSKMNCEDNDIPRICVSPSINGCLTATNRYDIGEILIVYICESNSYMQPSSEQVVDSPLTGEFWILQPVKLNKFMEIVIIEIFENTFEGFNNYFYAFERLV